MFQVRWQHFSSGKTVAEIYDVPALSIYFWGTSVALLLHFRVPLIHFLYILWIRNKAMAPKLQPKAPKEPYTKIPLLFVYFVVTCFLNCSVVCWRNTMCFSTFLWSSLFALISRPEVPEVWCLSAPEWLLLKICRSPIWCDFGIILGSLWGHLWCKLESPLKSKGRNAGGKHVNPKMKTTPNGQAVGLPRPFWRACWYNNYKRHGRSCWIVAVVVATFVVAFQGSCPGWWSDTPWSKAQGIFCSGEWMWPCRVCTWRDRFWTCDMHQSEVSGHLYQAPGTSHQIPGSLHQVSDDWYLVRDTKVSDTRHLVPGFSDPWRPELILYVHWWGSMHVWSMLGIHAQMPACRVLCRRACHKAKL